MKIANESSDTVEISKESLAALKKYNQTEVSVAAKKDHQAQVATLMIIRLSRKRILRI